MEEVGKHERSVEDEARAQDDQAGAERLVTFFVLELGFELQYYVFDNTSLIILP